jgi:hypothetical protein
MGLANAVFFSLLIVFPGIAVAKNNNIHSQLHGIVGDLSLTTKEVQLRALYEKFEQGNSGKKSVGLLTVGTKEFDAQLNECMLELMVYLEAASLRVAAPSNDLVDKKLSEFLEFLEKSLQIGIEKTWILATKKSELNNLIQRWLQAKSFVALKSDKSGIVPTDLEIKEFFEKNRMRFGDGGLDKYKANVRDYLVRKQSEDRLKEWFVELKKKYKPVYLEQMEIKPKPDADVRP